MFKQTPKQSLAQDVVIKHLYALLYGGGRSGKTFEFVRGLCLRSWKEKSRHLIARKHLNHVRQSIWQDTLPKVIKRCFPEVSNKLLKGMNNSDLVLRFPKKGKEPGSEIWLGGLDDKDRTEKVLGTEYSTIFLNEVSQISYSSVQIILTRLAEKNNLVKRAWFDMNPTSKKHWAFKMFLEKVNPEDNLLLKNPEDYGFFQLNPEDNIENIDENYLKILKGLPASKRKRFLEGEFSDDIIGAVFNTNNIKRLDKSPIDLNRIVIGHDPAITARITSDEHGIIVCARKGDNGYVLRDDSGIFSPLIAAQQTNKAYTDFNADRVVGEVNNGGDYIETVLRSVNKFISYKAVRAMKGKVKRAEPVAALYEQGRIYHIGIFPELESEMDDFLTDEKEMEYSPNRVDGLVWGFTELFNLYDSTPSFTWI